MDFSETPVMIVVKKGGGGWAKNCGEKKIAFLNQKNMASYKHLVAVV